MGRIASTSAASRRRAAELARLEHQVARLEPEHLGTDWRRGPPYPIPAEVDPERTRFVVRDRVRVHRRVLTDDVLRRARVLWAFAPSDDFDRTDVVGGVSRDALMGDVMASMTSVANPPAWRLFSRTPSYARELLAANLPAERRVVFLTPQHMAELDDALATIRPELVLLSGLNVNVPVLLSMALAARRAGAREVWLGNYASAAPYRLVDKLFDRVIWGPGEAYLYSQLVGGSPPAPAHPPVDRMMADVDWLTLDAAGAPARTRFRVLHVALRLGCSQSCTYCAENRFSGGSRRLGRGPDLRALLDGAVREGVRRVYFVDPDFGRIWEPQLEGRAMELLAERGMTWSCLTSTVALERHGDEMLEHGLRSAYVGIESLAPGPRGAPAGAHVRSLLNRRWQRSTEETLAGLRDRGLLVFGLYILGNPGESLDSMQRGVEALRDLVPLAQISTHQPFPGSVEFDDAAAAGWIHDYAPSSMRYGRSTWAPEGKPHDPDEIARLYVWAHEQVNDLERPGGFFDHLRHKRARG